MSGQGLSRQHAFAKALDHHGLHQDLELRQGASVVAALGIPHGELSTIPKGTLGRVVSMGARDVAVKFRVLRGVKVEDVVVTVGAVELKEVSVVQTDGDVVGHVIPLIPAFFVTAHRVMGMEFEGVGVDLDSMWGHGMLYTAMSRARNGDKVRFLCKNRAAVRQKLQALICAEICAETKKYYGY